MGKAKKVGVGIGAVVGTLAILVGSLVGVASCAWSGRLEATYTTADHDFEIPELTDANRAEAQRLYLVRGCGECHGADGAGRVMVDAPPFLLAPSNITGVMRSLSANELHKLIRRGIRPDGHPVFFMPSHEYARMPDEELGLITAYVRSLDQSSATPPASELRALGRVLLLVGAVEDTLIAAEMIDQSAPFDPASVDELGEYLATGCRGCHGATLAGGAIPGAPESEVGIPANLTPHEEGLAGWSQEEFTRAMREGTTPERTLNPDFMPTRIYEHLTDDEVGALWAYLQTVEARPFGDR